MLAWEEDDKSKAGFYRLGQKHVYMCGWLGEMGGNVMAMPHTPRKYSIMVKASALDMDFRVRVFIVLNIKKYGSKIGCRLAMSGLWLHFLVVPLVLPFPGSWLNFKWVESCSSSGYHT